jgi:acyl-CoA synthetase (AMP-forming)/AMP-acid ligase II
VIASVLDDDDRPVPAGELGLVVIKSPATMSGYYRDPEQTAAAFTTDGAVRTGDLGWLDGDGRLHLAGRNVERYVRGGYNVHPAEVEAVLLDHPAIAAVAVVPVPDPVMGQLGVAAVVPHPGQAAPTVAQLRAFATPRLAEYKLPERVVEVDEIPLTPMEKFDRPALERKLTQLSD